MRGREAFRTWDGLSSPSWPDRIVRPTYDAVAILLCVLVTCPLSIAGETKEAPWPPRKGLLLYLPFDKSAEPTVAWSKGTPLEQPKAPHAPTLVKGIRGTAAQFDGKDDFLLLPPLRDFKLEQFTLEAWIKPSGGKRGSLFINLADTGKSGIRFEKFYSAMVFRLGDGDRQYHCNSPEYLIQNDYWQHVAATYDGRLMKIFLNGKEIASAEAPAAIGPCNVPIRVGAYVNPVHYIYEGLVDEMVLFDTARTQDEIFRDMAASLRTRPE